MIKKKIAIIGGGPNAVYALEILLKKILKNNHKNIYKITIFDENGFFGHGNTHSKFLNKNILLNRIAGQISLGSYPFIKFKNNLRKFDYNFMEWCKKNNLNVKPTDWPPRATFGQALEDKLYDLLFLFTKYTSIKIELVFGKINKLSKIKKKYFLTSKYSNFEFDFLLICTGNYISNIKSTFLSKKINKLSKNTNCNYIYNYLEKLPKENFWNRIRNSNIALIGTGTSSLDLIKLLYKNKNNIFPISKSFLFPFARPFNQKISNPKKLEHKPIILNNNLIYILKKELNKPKNYGSLNFESFIHPFIIAEFYLIYFENFLKKKEYLIFKNIIKKKISQKIKAYNIKNNLDLELLLNQKIIYLFKKNKINKKFFKLNWFANKEIINAVLNERLTFYDLFVDPLYLFKNKKFFLKSYLKFIKWDIAEAKKGNLNSSYKKACDGLWRDARPQFTKLFDNCNNLKIYSYFLKRILPIHNKLCDGPSVKMIIFVKNLIIKKIIKFKFLQKYKFKNIKNDLFLLDNKNKQKLDYIFCAIANLFKESYQGDKLIESMLKLKLVSLNNKIIKKKKYTIGLNLNSNQHPVNKNGKVFKFIKFIGPASEGKKFFHHTLARPDKKQPNFVDLVNWVQSVVVF